MKVIILAGGLGTRISEETKDKPKPMVKIGPFTLIEHIMNIYSRSGITEFIIATGYLHDVIDKYFEKYTKYSVTPIFTGDETKTGGRIKRVFSEFPDETMCVTYGDGLSNINIADSLNFHGNHGCLATVTAVQPQARFGRLNLINDSVIKFGEKIQSDEGWINGGFFVLNRRIAEYISGDAMPFESDPLIKLSSEGQLKAFKHFGFWSPVDSLREKQDLEDLWNSGNPPWTQS
jgi:glucose-1-phosphate cytidylyltransferase